MKRILIFLSAIVMTLACGPSRYAVHVEMLQPSKSGLELTGKILSVVCYEGADSLENQMVEAMSKAFAEDLEKDYATGEGSVGVYDLDKGAGQYSSRDSLIRLVGRTGSDVVFLMEPSFTYDVPGTGNGRTMVVTVYCYDGMDKADKVRRFVGNAVLSASDKAGQIAEMTQAGKQMAQSFKAQWKHEQYSLAYYDSQKWYEALARAEQFDWKGAMDIWIELLNTNDSLKRASAQYNISVACYMLGDYDLALSWLDRSDEEGYMPTLSDALRKRIKARKQ